MLPGAVLTCYCIARYVNTAVQRFQYNRLICIVSVQHSLRDSALSEVRLGGAPWSSPNMLLYIQLGKVQLHIFSVKYRYSQITDLCRFCLALSTRSCPVRVLLGGASWSSPKMLLYIQVRFSSNLQYTVQIFPYSRLIFVQFSSVQIFPIERLILFLFSCPVRVLLGGAPQSSPNMLLYIQVGFS